MGDPDLAAVVAEGNADDIMKAAAEIAVAHLGVPGDFHGVDGLLIVGVHKVFHIQDASGDGA